MTRRDNFRLDDNFNRSFIVYLIFIINFDCSCLNFKTIKTCHKNTSPSNFQHSLPIFCRVLVDPFCKKCDDFVTSESKSYKKMCA